jgi:hypothetical protein
MCENENWIRLLEDRDYENNHQLPYRAGTSRLPERRVASEEGLCYVQLVMHLLINSR